MTPQALRDQQLIRHVWPDWPEKKQRFNWLKRLIRAVVIGGIITVLGPLFAKAHDTEFRLYSWIYGCESAEEMKGVLDIMGKEKEGKPPPTNVEGCEYRSPIDELKRVLGGLPVIIEVVESYENENLKATITVLMPFGDPSVRFYSWQDLERKSADLKLGKGT